MAVFAKNTLTQVSGFDNPIIAGELVYDQQTYWNLQLTTEDILEIGSGHGSTGFILDSIKNTSRKLTTLENNKDWYNEMLLLYPESENHKYHFVENYESQFEIMKNKHYSIVFIDSSPWESRISALKTFYNNCDYLIVHDADYFTINNLLNYDDYFNSCAMCHPAKPYCLLDGPPTFVGSNTHII
jgi:hypothetical protein